MADGLKMSIRITRVAPNGVLDDQLVTAMGNLGNAITRRAQRLVPKRTWALHDTIAPTTEKVGAGKVVTRVSAGCGRVGYALYVEKGTSRQRPQPYLRPAMLQSRPGDLRGSGGPGPSKGAPRK